MMCWQIILDIYTTTTTLTCANTFLQIQICQNSEFGSFDVIATLEHSTLICGHFIFSNPSLGTSGQTKKEVLEALLFVCPHPPPPSQAGQHFAPKPS